MRSDLSTPWCSYELKGRNCLVLRALPVSAGARSVPGSVATTAVLRQYIKRPRTVTQRWTAWKPLVYPATRRLKGETVESKHCSSHVAIKQ